MDQMYPYVGKFSYRPAHKAPQPTFLQVMMHFLAARELLVGKRRDRAPKTGLLRAKLRRWPRTLPDRKDRNNTHSRDALFSFP